MKQKNDWTTSTACERGASVWLTTIPIKEEGFNIDKNTFWDLVKVRYAKQLDRLPDICVCKSSFNIMLFLARKVVSSPSSTTLKHNSVLLSEVCEDAVEPRLATITGENLPCSTIKSDETRLDISARGFWIPGQKAFFDVRVFNPIAGRYRNQSLSKCHEMNEREKKTSECYNVIKVVSRSSFLTRMVDLAGNAEHFINHLMLCLPIKENNR